MGNVLKVEKIQQIQTLAKLGRSIRRISRELTVDRGTVSKYRLLVQNPPKVPTDLGQQNLPPTQSAKIHPHRSTIYLKYLQRLSPQQIYQDWENRGTLFPYFLIQALGTGCRGMEESQVPGNVRESGSWLSWSVERSVTVVVVVIVIGYSGTKYQEPEAPL
jgi:hypothetical protein